MKKRNTRISGCSIEFENGYISRTVKATQGFMKLCDTHGIPLELVLQKLKDNNLMVDWVDYITDCLQAGHNPSTIRSRILEAVGDVYGSKYRNEVKTRLDRLFA